MHSSFIEYRHGDQLLEGYLAWEGDSTQRRPAVLIAHAWAGRDQFECEMARKLAGLGYAAFAMDNYGKGVLGSNNEENAALMTPFLEDRAMLRDRLLAGLKALVAQPMVDANKVAAIGFCFGGLCVLDLARCGAELRGVVSFHGLFNAPNLPETKITASILALHGHDDPMVPPEAVLALEQELSRAGADWQIHAYGGTSHAFTNPQANAPEMGLLFNPKARDRAWRAMSNFLEEIFNT